MMLSGGYDRLYSLAELASADAGKFGIAVFSALHPE